MLMQSTHPPPPLSLSLSLSLTPPLPPCLRYRRLRYRGSISDGLFRARWEHLPQRTIGTTPALYNDAFYSEMWLNDSTPLLPHWSIHPYSHLRRICGPFESLYLDLPAFL